MCLAQGDKPSEVGFKLRTSQFGTLRTTAKAGEELIPHTATDLPSKKVNPKAIESYDYGLPAEKTYSVLLPQLYF